MEDNKRLAFGQDSHEHAEAEQVEQPPKMRGGTREQHVNAGRAGGKAPHKCRGRQCSKESKE